MGSKQFEPQSSIGCFSDLISGILQHLDEQPAYRRLIFDDQDRGYTQSLTGFLRMPLSRSPTTLRG